MDLDLTKIKYFGRSFVFDFVVREHNKKTIEQAYKMYVTGCLRIQTCFLTGKEDLPLWTDVLEKMKKRADQPEKSAKEVIIGMKKKFKRMFEGGDDDELA